MGAALSGASGTREGQHAMVLTAAGTATLFCHAPVAQPVKSRRLLSARLKVRVLPGVSRLDGEPTSGLVSPLVRCDRAPPDCIRAPGLTCCAWRANTPGSRWEPSREPPQRPS